MNARNRTSPIGTLIVLFLVFVLLFALGQVGLVLGGGWAWVLLLLALLSLFYLMGGMCGHAGRAPHVRPHFEEPPRPPEVDTADLFAAQSERHVGLATIREGRLLGAPDDVMTRLRERFRGSGWTPLLTPAEDGAPSLALLPISLERGEQAPQRPWLHALLFVATFVTTTWAGALHQGVNLLQEPERFAAGLPYALGLMLILGAHEMGHFFAARHHGMSVSLPYFIPVPFGLGTFGAFISLRSPAPSRRALFDMAVAGPLDGLVFAVPALLIGLPLSQVVPEGSVPAMSMHGGGVNIGSSLLLATLAKVGLGEQLVGHTLQLHPLAFAGWLGLIVTALNLLPIGQLDGGHIADAMFGQRASAMISTAAMFALFGLGLFVWSGLLFWAFIVFFIAGRKGLPPLNDLTPLAPPRLALGWVAMAILAAILIPVPHGLFESLGIRCPYL